MTVPPLPFLTALKREIGDELLPMLEPGMAQHLGMLSHRILGRLVTDQLHVPGIQAISADAYEKLLPDLRAAAEGTPISAQVEALAKALSGVRDYGAIETTIQAIAGGLTGLGTAAARTALRGIAAIEKRHQTDFIEALKRETERSADGSGEDAGVISADEKQRLLAFIKAAFPAEGALEISGVELVPGGFSKQTMFIALANARELPASIVLRMDKADSPVLSTVLDEFKVISPLWEAGIAVPQPFALEPTGTVLEGPFMLLGRASGRNVGNSMDVLAGSLALAKDLAATLARLHAIPEEQFAGDIYGSGKSVTERMLDDLDELETSWRSFDMPSIALETAIGWLRDNIHLADGPRALIHRDIGCHNMLVDEDRVSALLDWETAAIGTPAQDLGYMRRTMEQMCDWEDFIAAYGEAGGTPPRPEQVEYYALWGFAWLNVLQMRAAVSFLTGETNDIRIGYSVAYLLSRRKLHLARQLDRVLSIG